MDDQINNQVAGKSKIVAFVLAFFFSYWSWLYTFKYDGWKFGLGLVAQIGAVIVSNGTAAAVVGGLAIWGAFGLWAIIDQLVKKDGLYRNYRQADEDQLSSSQIITRVVISLLVLSLVIFSMKTSFNSKLPDNEGVSGTVAEQHQASPAGSSVRDAALEFRVYAFNCNYQNIVYDLPGSAGGQDTVEPELDQFCQLNYNVRNTGDTELTVSNSHQVGLDSATDADNQQLEYPARYLFDQIPDNCQETILPADTNISLDCSAWFDLPADADITQIRFHADQLSGGNVVNLN